MSARAATANIFIAPEDAGAAFLLFDFAALLRLEFTATEEIVGSVVPVVESTDPFETIRPVIPTPNAKLLGDEPRPFFPMSPASQASLLRYSGPCGKLVLMKKRK